MARDAQHYAAHHFTMAGCGDGVHPANDTTGSSVEQVSYSRNLFWIPSTRQGNRTNSICAIFGCWGESTVFFFFFLRTDCHSILMRQRESEKHKITIFSFSKVIRFTINLETDYFFHYYIFTIISEEEGVRIFFVFAKISSLIRQNIVVLNENFIVKTWVLYSTPCSSIYIVYICLFVHNVINIYLKLF